MYRILSTTLSGLVGLLVFGGNLFASPIPDCFQTRCALDIGSSTTKIRVAKVDTCRQKVKQILYPRTDEDVDQLTVRYKESVTATGRIDGQTAAAGIAAINELLALAQTTSSEPLICSGVATAAFRQADNGSLIAQQLAAATEVAIQIVTQDEEAVLGFYGVTAHLETPTAKAVVWDIGGGSMQIITQSPQEEDQYIIYKGNLAAETFRDFIITEVQDRVADTPNPISQQDYNTAMARIEQHATNDIPNALKAKFEDTSTIVYGIGGVHYYSIRGQIMAPEDKFYTRAQVTIKAENQLNLTDEQIGGEFASTQVSNLILAQGYMKAMNLNQVHPVKVNLADGVLVAHLYHQF